MGAGVSVETVRFYKREGLLEQPARRPSGYREYSEEAVWAITHLVNSGRVRLVGQFREAHIQIN